MNKKDRLGLKTWVEIDKKAIAGNYKIFRHLADRTRLMTVVKSNAYGHGLVAVSKILEKSGVDWFGVDSVPEALALRKEKITKPILVLAYTLPELFPLALSHNISVAISSFESIEAIKKMPTSAFAEGQRLKVHIKVDTGMRRHGFYLEDLLTVLLKLKAMPNKILIEGVFSHLASGESANSKRNLSQLSEFEKVKKIVSDFGLSPIFHLNNTPGFLASSETKSDLVRIGLGIYGIWPTEILRQRLSRRVKLKPALTWKTIIAEVKDIKRGEAVGYGWTERVKQTGRIAICPVGYWHGYRRNLSSRGQVLVRGRRAKVLGVVSMDIITIDISKIKNVSVGDEVVLVDSQVLANEIADMSGTISYEILTGINPLIRRFYC